MVKKKVGKVSKESKKPKTRRLCKKDRSSNHTKLRTKKKLSNEKLVKRVKSISNSHINLQRRHKPAQKKSKSGRGIKKRYKSSSDYSDSSDVSDESEDEYDPPQKRIRVVKARKCKRKCRKTYLYSTDSSEHVMKNMRQNKSGSTMYYRNPKYSGSNDSINLGSRLSHIHENTFDCGTSKSVRGLLNTQQKGSFICKMDNNFVKKDLLSALDGKTLLRESPGQPLTEVKFQTALLVNVKPITSSSAVASNSNIGVEHTSVDRRVNNPFIKYSAGNLKNHSSTLLNVKRSQNFTDLNSQRKMFDQDIDRNEHCISRNSSDLRNILPPQPIQSSMLNCNVRGQLGNSEINSVGDHRFAYPLPVHFSRRRFFQRQEHSIGESSYQQSGRDTAHTNSDNLDDDVINLEDYDEDV